MTGVIDEVLNLHVRIKLELQLYSRARIFPGA